MTTGFEKQVEKIRRLCESLSGNAPAVRIMEVCGTHTMAIARSGLRSLLPEAVKLISGPGCPVCVTDQSYIDQALMLAGGEAGCERPIIATYGDMVRVPGRKGSLGEARAKGAEVEVVYSADSAVELAICRPDRQVVFLAVGFETTTPATALAILRARAEGIKNFFVLTAHKLILPAMQALLSADDIRIDAFMCPGHVSVIIGFEAYRSIVKDFAKPCVVAGFDPGQIMEGIAVICEQLAAKRPRACSVYPPVKAAGNSAAMKLFDDVFQPADVPWRALGVIPASGLELREQFACFDAARRFDLPPAESYELPGCRCGDVISGRCDPQECSMFSKRCTPRDPLGPCMVSSEGACAAAYKYDGARKRAGKANG